MRSSKFSEILSISFSRFLPVPTLATTRRAGVSRNQKKGKGAITALLHRPLSLEQQQEQDRRYVAMCAVDLRPYNMSATAAFQHWLGGYSPELVKKTIHRTTINKNLESLCADVRAVMTAKLAAHYESVKKRGWTGPWISMQCDATSTNNTEYYTVSFSWVPEDWSGMERVAFCTRAFPGKHTAAEVEPWLREVC